MVFAGHEHFYERLSPQNGIQHFITGAGGQLRRGNIRQSTQTAAGYDRDNSFMIVEVTDDTMWFESLSRQNEIVDSGVIDRKTGIRAIAASPDNSPIRDRTIRNYWCRNTSRCAATRSTAGRVYASGKKFPFSQSSSRLP